MRCKNKNVWVDGIEMDVMGQVKRKNFVCTITNDEKGKTLSIGNGMVQFTIPFEAVERWLK